MRGGRSALVGRVPSKSSSSFEVNIEHHSVAHGNSFSSIHAMIKLLRKDLWCWKVNICGEQERSVSKAAFPFFTAPRGWNFHARYFRSSLVSEQIPNEMLKPLHALFAEELFSLLLRLSQTASFDNGSGALRDNFLDIKNVKVFFAIATWLCRHSCSNKRRNGIKNVHARQKGKRWSGKVLVERLNIFLLAFVGTLCCRCLIDGHKSWNFDRHVNALCSSTYESNVLLSWSCTG